MRNIFLTVSDLPFWHNLLLQNIVWRSAFCGSLACFWCPFGILLVPIGSLLQDFQPASANTLLKRGCPKRPASKGVGGRPDVTMLPKPFDTLLVPSGSIWLHFWSNFPLFFMLLAPTFEPNNQNMTPTRRLN